MWSIITGGQMCSAGSRINVRWQEAVNQFGIVLCLAHSLTSSILTIVHVSQTFHKLFLHCDLEFGETLKCCTVQLWSACPWPPTPWPGATTATPPSTTDPGSIRGPGEPWSTSRGAESAFPTVRISRYHFQSFLHVDRWMDCFDTCGFSKLL